MEFVDGASDGILTFYEIGLYELLTPTVNVPDPVRTSPLLGNLLFLVIEPLYGLEGFVDVGTPPSTDRCDGDGIGW